MAARIEALLIVPANDNNGVAFVGDDWDELHARLAQVSDGYTRRGPHLGGWRDAGVDYIEPVYDYEVALVSWFEVPAFLAVVEWAKGHFKQLAIMFKIAGIPETYS